MSASSPKRPRHQWLAALIVIAASAATTTQAGTLSAIYSFTGGADGAAPYAGLTSDAAGNLYGETFYGGNVCPGVYPYGCGTLYRLPVGGSLQTLTTFTGSKNGADGYATPTLSGKRLYGSTYGGGMRNTGLLFSTSISGTQFKVLHKFAGTDGVNPSTVLLLDASGDLYGTTSSGGPAYSKKKPGSGLGVLFELKPDGTYIPLHDFMDATDGYAPERIVFDSAGTIYGTTRSGGTGSANCGVLYSFVPSSAVFTVLHTFTDGDDGCDGQLGGMDKNGNLYGASSGGGANQYGTLFKLTSAANGYDFSIIYTFTGGSDGAYPNPPSVAPDGTLTATTLSGPVTQAGAGSGTLYRFSAEHLTTLYTFVNDANGGVPRDIPIVAKNGVISGTTSSGGIKPCNTSGGKLISSGGCGIIYQFTP